MSERAPERLSLAQASDLTGLSPQSLKYLIDTGVIDNEITRLSSKRQVNTITQADIDAIKIASGHLVPRGKSLPEAVGIARNKETIIETAKNLLSSLEQFDDDEESTNGLLNAITGLTRVGFTNDEVEKLQDEVLGDYPNKDRVYHSAREKLGNLLMVFVALVEIEPNFQE